MSKSLTMSDPAATIEATEQATGDSGQETLNDIPSAAELREILGMAPEPAAEQKPEDSQEAAEGTKKPEEAPAAEAGTISEEAGTETEPAAEEAVEAEKPAETEEKKEEPAAEDPLKKQIEALQAEIAALKAQQSDHGTTDNKTTQEVQPAPMPVRADFFGLDELTLNEVRAAEKVKRWAEANPEGGEVAGADGQPEVISPARVQALLSESNGILAAARQAGRERFTAAQRQAEEYVREHYPTLADRKSEDFKAYERTIAAIPQLAQWPDAKVQVARLLRGFRAEQEEIKKRQAAATKAPAKETAVPKAPAAGAVPRAAVSRTKPQTSQRDSQLAELRKRAEAGDQAAAEQYFAMQG